MTLQSGTSVLLVDDQPANLLALEAVLHETGAQLVRAGSGEQALKLAGERDFAAILLDVRMPGMDGYEAARLIRAQPRSASTPIIFVTAFDSADVSIEEAYALGAVDFLTKPIIAPVLQAKVAFFIELYNSKEELRAAERQAVNERAFLAAVLEAVEDGIVACDADGVLTLFNRATRQLHGLPEEPLPAERWAEHYRLYQADGESPLTKEQIPLFRALSGEKVHRAGMVVAPMGGKPRSLLASGQSLYDQHGRKLGAVVSMHDVTAQREAEAAREATLREQGRREEAEAAAAVIRQSEVALRHLAGELAESDRRKTEFLATLAHELRNPLAPLRNGLHVMRLASSNPLAVEKTREMMERQITHMVKLVDDLLDVARITSGKVHLTKETLDLRDIIAIAVETSMPLVEASGHALEINLPEESLLLEVDQTRLAQVLSNLLNNAAKYTPDGGRIQLAAARDGTQVVVQVSDTGIGIPPEALPSVFQMFTQVGRHTDRSQGGLGIGLSLVRGLVELHGGQVTAASAGPGQGSVFSVRLPLADAPGNGPAARLNGTDAATEGRQGLRVLVVDDNTDAAESLAMILQMSGHVARVAHDGQQALRLAASFLPQMVFLDIGMPGMNGYEVARELRKADATPRPLLVALTGWGAEDDRARSKEAGFDHHLTKPAEPAAVERLLLTLHSHKL